MRFWYCLASLAAVVCLDACCASAQDCHGLVGKNFRDARIIETDEVVPPFAITGLGDPKGVSVKTPFCRARGIIKPSSDSDINFEVWLPPVGTWNGRYEGVGNGGFAGTVIYEAMYLALQAGYAASGTDTGHSGFMNESLWALGHPEKVKDLGWRAIHETAVASKEIITAYYGKAAAYSYYSGCSTGGRQGLVEAQRFPGDYNGIVVGAPANYWPQLLASDLLTIQTVSAKPENWVSPEKLAFVQTKAMEACNAENGIIDDPSQCHFNPSSLICKEGRAEGCLSATEVATLQEIYSGLKDANDTTIYPGFPPGGEAAWGRSKMGPGRGQLTESLTYPMPTGFFRYLAFGNLDWDFRKVNPMDVLRQAVNSAADRAVYSSDPDLNAFREAGGKLIQYHGWNDPAIPAGSSIKYYESVATKMGGVEKIKTFYRLFMAPGMEHCGGGPGPNTVTGVFGESAPSHDPDHDVVAAVAHWVEDGVAPTQITATLYRDTDRGKEIVAQRPWCAYPAIAHYSGHGDRSQASSYACVAPHE